MKIFVFSVMFLFQFLFGSNQEIAKTASTNAPNFHEKEENPWPGASNIIFQSTDGGQNWVDISDGLPEKIQGDGFYANSKELYLHSGNTLYHTKSNANDIFWQKEIGFNDFRTISSGRTGLFAFNDGGGIYKKQNGTSLWLPIFKNFPQRNVRTILETADGTIFIGCGYGIYKSTNNGETWKQVHKEGWVMKIVESNSVLIATNEKGILRSNDNGESWNLVISEGGVGIAAENIDGGFAVISYNTTSKTRRIRASYDGGTTWQPIDNGLPGEASIASIKQVGTYLFCGHPKGIFRSSDKGKTWKLLLPSIGTKVFNLSVMGNIIYAIPRFDGC